MQLFEHEGKALLARRGIEVPRGGLWPDLPVGLAFPVAVKAQTLSGGRGLRGGIRRAGTPAEAEAEVRALLAWSAAGELADGILIEEWIDGREAYVAVLIDRDAAAPLLLVSAAGGVDVEEHSQFSRLPIDPWAGPGSDHSRLLRETLGISREAATSIIAGMWDAVVAEDALLVEVNPLGITADRCVALDVRVVLDESARFRHPDWPPPRGGTPFEHRCAALGSAGVEMGGDIAIITSGAGLGMASVDLVHALGGTVRALVDLGPVVFQQPERIAEVVALTASLRPRVLLVNFFLQLVRCDSVARGVVGGLTEPPGHVVVRMKGVRQAEARAILASVPSIVHEDLAPAFRAAVDAATRGGAP